MKLLMITLLTALSFGVFASETQHSSDISNEQVMTDQQQAQLMEESFNHWRSLYIVYYTTGTKYEQYGEHSYAFRDAAAVMATFFADPSLVDVYVEKIKNGEMPETAEFTASNLLRGAIIAVFDWKF